MNETMLVRAAGGGWEELLPQTTLPEGGIVEVFGEDIGPVLSAPAPVIVAACSPTLSTGSPDAICLDPDGGIWIVQMDLVGGGEQALPQLLAFGGGLAGASYDAFSALCERAAGESLSTFIETAAPGAGFHAQSFEVAVADALANGRFRLVAIVREAAPTLVQSMRFLNASGANGLLYEATSFASSSVSAVRAKSIDVGRAAVAAPKPGIAADPAAAATGGQASPAPAPVPEFGAASFVAATGKASGDDTAKLMAQLQKACSASFDSVVYEQDDTGAFHLRARVDTMDGPVALVDSGTDGSVVISFEAIAPVDKGWSVRTELCQGMERLLGADLGDVRKISQLNLSIGEHLMDATLMEALGELLADTVEALHETTQRQQQQAAA